MLRWTEDEEIFFAARWLAGDPISAIADAMAERGWPVRANPDLYKKRAQLRLPKRWARGERQRLQPEPRQPPWPEDRTQQLLAMRAAGLTFTECAKRLSATKGAVAGCLFRLRQQQAPEAFHVRA